MVVVNGLEIAHRQSTGTGRPVVLVHGNSSSSRTWQPLLDGPFGKRFRCLALDLPGHGGSQSPDGGYSMATFTAAVSGFADVLDVPDAVFVGWSLGGHIVLEAEPQLPDAAGFAIFGTPPLPSPAAVPSAFLSNPAMGVGFSREVGEEDAAAYAASFVAPGSALPLHGFIADILATDPASREGIGAAIGSGAISDEAAIVAGLKRPLAVLHGGEEQLVSLEYLRGLDIPTLWRGDVQVLDGVGHAPHEEAPEAFAELLAAFVDDLD
ncbi:alpha/beta fold hydrolase [Umezawaea endophytica]|uniref:Alpha/beta hydrolase n=1 Tax=Umezawaea endophytica TaxID=1654476 RepID=A0A9X2VGX5_9PSEU|nr:alpha/beta hydrolase [Umezawaea endophytica]MCS7476224.1 alpha/beta hydrolase [Umezawaea endophytica]